MTDRPQLEPSIAGASGVAVSTSREWSWSGSSRTWHSSLRVADQWMAEALGVGVVEGHVAVRLNRAQLAALLAQS